MNNFLFIILVWCNFQPSSSGRSALLLNNVKIEAGVMKIAGTDLPALFPSLAAPNIDPLVSPELQLCIKKLHKKDPITKTKVSRLFSTKITGHIENNSIKNVKNVMLLKYRHYQ